MKHLLMKYLPEILQLSDIRDEVKDVIRDGLNDILSRTYNTWYCNITQNLAVKINNLLETSEFRNWHSGGDDDDAQINEINAEAFDNNLTLALVQTTKDTLTNSNIAGFSDIVDLFSSEEFSNEIKIKINQLRNQELNVDRMDVDGILVDDILANQYLSELPHYNNLVGDIFEGIINTLKHNEMDKN